MIKPLIWKEWHEQRWKLAFGCVLLIGYPAIGLQSRLLPDEIIIFFGTTWSGWMMPMLVAMGLVAVERANGSLGTLLALPVKSWKIFMVKFLTGAVVCVVPILGSMIVALLIASGRELNPSDIVVPYLCSIAFGFVMYIWIIAFGIRQPSEARVGLVGIAIFIGWGAIVMIADELVTRPLDRWSLAITPFGFFEIGWDRDYSLLPKTIPIQLVLAVCLIIWGAHRFSRLERTKI